LWSSDSEVPFVQATPLTDAFLFDAMRTPRGKARDTGGLHAVRPIELIAALMRALLERNRLEAAAIDDVVLGCVTQTGEQGANLARIAALFAGWDPRVPGMTVNRFCASGLDACRIAAGAVMTGSAALVAAGGVESMSRVPLFADAGPWFADPEVARATSYLHMGVAADLLATRAGIDRAALDAYAARSHQRAAAARDAGRFARSMVPIAGLDRDELIRDGTTAEQLGRLPAAFADLEPGRDLGPRDHRHTIGTSPGVCDGASLLLVGSRARGEALGLEPRARIAASASVGGDPVVMLAGNVPATERVLAAAGLRPRDIDLFEVNESFAAVPLHFARSLDIDEARLNPNGGAIALGHPMGATGCLLLATLLDELDRIGGRWGIASICGGAGVATAILVERTT
jgi:acetyl-CoA C-acetyltransferase